MMGGFTGRRNLPNGAVWRILGRQARSVQAMEPTVTREAEAGPGRAGWRLHGFALALLALGGVVGLALWGKWGLLIAFDTIRAYCF